METETVLEWVAAYERAWRDRDADAVWTLFTEDAHYRHSPYEPSLVGHEAVAAGWVDPRPFTMSAAPVAAQGSTAVVRVQVDYTDPVQQYLDLWVITFAADGRAVDFEEWAYWPGRPYTPND